MALLVNDLRYGARALLKSPMFSGVAVLALALGIGATTALFTVVNGVLLRPLPHEDGERLVSDPRTGDAARPSASRATGCSSVAPSHPTTLNGWSAPSFARLSAASHAL